VAQYRLNFQQRKADVQRSVNYFKLAPQKKFAGPRRLAAAIICFAGLSSRGETHLPLPYLPAVGPAPLRFLAMAMPATNIFKPPAPAPLPLKPETERVDAPASPNPTNTPANVPIKTIFAPAGETNTIGGTPETTTPEGVISPQMLLKFFNKSTNGVSSSVIMPMDFQPPNPAPAPSKATYSTGP